MFWKKKSDKDETIEKIKEAVSSGDREEFEDFTELDMDKIFGPLPKEKPDLDVKKNHTYEGTDSTTPKSTQGIVDSTIPSLPTPPEKTEATKQPQERKTPPVFIKLDRYEEIINNINNIRTSLSNLHEIMKVFEEIENTRSDVIESIRATVDKIDAGISYLDSILVKPSGLGIKPEKLTSDELDKSLEKLKKEIEDIKNAVSSL